MPPDTDTLHRSTDPGDPVGAALSSVDHVAEAAGPVTAETPLLTAHARPAQPLQTHTLPTPIAGPLPVVIGSPVAPVALGATAPSAKKSIAGTIPLAHHVGDDHPLIELRTGPAGRTEPAIVGTRLLVRQIVACIFAHQGHLTRTAAFLDIRTAAVRAAAAYYSTHRPQVDADIAWAGRVEAELRAEWQHQRTLAV